MLASWFQSPTWLLLALLVPAIALWDVRRGWGDAGARQAVGVSIRSLLLLALVTAAAGPRCRTASQAASVIFVIDRSASIGDDALSAALARADALRAGLSGEERPALVLFDDAPELVVAPGEPWRLPGPRPTPVEATDLAGTLALALGLIPADGAGRVVLFTDGRETSGDVTEVVADARARGVPIHPIPLAPSGGASGLAAIALDADEVRPGAAVAGRVALVGGARDRVAVLTVRVAGEVALELPVTLLAGEPVEVPFTHALAADAPAGWIDVEARIEGDPEPARTRLAVRQPLRVTVIVAQAAEATPLRAALEAEGMTVDVVSPRAVDLDDVDLVVLGNVSASGDPRDPGRLADGAPDAIAEHVRRGGGLVTLGGDRSYDNGGWEDTALARVLPLEMGAPDVEIDPPASLLLILDVSGSMGAFAGGSTKMALANEGAVASLALLRPMDRYGVLAFDDHPEWPVRLGAVVDQAATARRVRQIPAAGGGIFVYSALSDARAALRSSPTPIKHVILFCDARDAEEKTAGRIMGWGTGESSLVLAARMRKEGVTTSVIAIGAATDVDAEFLEDLAAAGGGRHYLTSDARELRTLFVEETQRIVRPNLREQPFLPVLALPHPALEGIDVGRAPALRGLVELEPRPTSEVALTDPDGRPVLATWRYGLGQVASLTIDAGPRLARGWVDWDGYPRFWTQLARWAARDRAGEGTALEIDTAGDGAVIRVAHRDADGLSRAGAVRIRVTDEDRGGGVDAVTGLAEPGLWEGRVEIRPGVAYRVDAIGPDGAVLATRGFVAPPSAELRHRIADHALLQRIATETGGEVDATRITGPTALRSEVHPVWGWLVLLAALLLPIDAFVRRSARG